MFVKKFAVTHTIGNRETVLKTFPEKQKSAALSWGKEAAAGLEQGVIACVLAEFDEANQMRDHQCRVFEVWPSGESGAMPRR